MVWLRSAMDRLGRALAALVVLVAFAMVLCRTTPAVAASDPSLRWYTIETPHFRITYHSGIEEVAQHVANVGEDIFTGMGAAVGTNLTEPTEIILTDFNESANGSAGALPYNAIHLIVTAPEDMSPLGDVDDWYLELTTHEYTHILHTDHIRGIPALVNAVLGKTLAPNQVLAAVDPRRPRRLPGERAHQRRTPSQLAVGHVHARRRARRQRGHARSAVEHRAPLAAGQPLLPLRLVLHGLDRRHYGEDALRKMVDDYGKQIVPWGFNRSIRRATGKTYVEMYDPWVDSMKVQYQAQAAEVRRRGLREGTRITHTGQITRYPRWIPKNAWPEYAGGLLYYRDDQHTRAGLYALPVQRDARGAITNVKDSEKHVEHIARVAGESVASFLPDGGVVFGAQEISKNVYLYGDLEQLAPGAKSTFGTQDGGRSRVTYDLRASDPTTSPDGRRIVFTINNAGTRSLHIADLTDSGIANMRPLVSTAFMEQAFTPRWSPDGTHIAYSVWKRGGYRDIRYVDVATGSYRDITFDSRRRRRAQLLGRRQARLLPLRPHGHRQHLRLGGRHDALPAGHERDHRRVHAGALAGRKDARLCRLHDRRLRPLRDAARREHVDRRARVRRRAAPPGDGQHQAVAREDVQPVADAVATPLRGGHHRGQLRARDHDDRLAARHHRVPLGHGIDGHRAREARAPGHARVRLRAPAVRRRLPGVAQHHPARRLPDRAVQTDGHPGDDRVLDLARLQPTHALRLAVLRDLAQPRAHRRRSLGHPDRQARSLRDSGLPRPRPRERAPPSGTRTRTRSATCTASARSAASRSASRSTSPIRASAAIFRASSRTAT